MTINWVLAESSRTRYAAGSSMYFAQGIPYGLMNIAIPAWLATILRDSGDQEGALEIAYMLARRHPEDQNVVALLRSLQAIP